MAQVEVTEGILEGEVIENEYGGQFSSFKGIPYAEPPLGSLRFKVRVLIFEGVHFFIVIYEIFMRNFV